MLIPLRQFCKSARENRQSQRSRGHATALLIATPKTPSACDAGDMGARQDVARNSWAERTPTPGWRRAWTFAKAIVDSQRARRIPAARGMKAVRGCQLTPQIGRRLRRGSRRASNAAAVARPKEDPSKGAEAPTDLRRDGQPAAVALLLRAEAEVRSECWSSSTPEARVGPSPVSAFLAEQQRGR
jgi:hypothetical protein